MSVEQTNLHGALPLINKGKVRDIYEINNNELLFVATDRISAFDVILENGIPSKGAILTSLSNFWFEGVLKDICPNHLISTDLTTLPTETYNKLKPYISQLEKRSMIVKKYKLIPLEVIVRGYITGSAWNEYVKHGTVHGIKIQPGLSQCEAFDKPIYTPSTKAEAGEHDENISPKAASDLIGEELNKRVEALALSLYKTAHEFAKKRGIIIADTKFEFGIDTQTNKIILVDEVLTPDSSRFWSAETYKIGQDQDSFDKQFLRNWLIANNLKGKNGVKIPQDIVEKTRAKYIEVYQKLTNEKWQD